MSDQIFKIAEDFIDNKNYRKALDLLQKSNSLEENINNNDLKFLLAKCFLRTKNYKSCLNMLNSILKIDSSILMAQYLKAECLKESEDVSSAGELFGNIVSRIKKNPSMVGQPIYYDSIAFQIECVFEDGEHDYAAELLNNAMSLEGIESNINYLCAYGNIALTYNKYEESARCLLKSVTVDSNNKRCKELFVKLIKSEYGLSAVKQQLIPSAQSAAAYAFFATFAKDLSELKLSSELYKLSLSLISENIDYIHRVGPSYILNLVHVYEALYEYELAVKATILYLETFSSLKCGKNGFDSVLLLNALKSKSNADERLLTKKDETLETLAWVTEDTNEPDGYLFLNDLNFQLEKEEYDFSSLDLLAIGFTLVKIKYLQGGGVGGSGDASSLEALLKVVEPTRRNSLIPLHQTAIRNEAAYYCCIAQVLSEKKLKDVEIKSVFTAESTSSNSIYVCGDSHVLPLAWSHITKPTSSSSSLDTASSSSSSSSSLQSKILIPKLVTGVKHWHLRPNSKFYPKAQFYNALRTIPDGSEVTRNSFLII